MLFLLQILLLYQNEHDGTYECGLFLLLTFTLFTVQILANISNFIFYILSNLYFIFS